MTAVLQRVCLFCLQPRLIFRKSRSIKIEWTLLFLFWETLVHSSGWIRRGTRLSRPMGSREMKSETILRNGAFTGFPALFLHGCKPALGLVLIGLPNKKQPRFAVFRQVYRFWAILYKQWQPFIHEGQPFIPMRAKQRGSAVACSAIRRVVSAGKSIMKPSRRGNRPS